MSVTLHLRHGDCLVRLQELDEGSVGAVVCDPPYEIFFMGRGWDGTGIAYDPALWAHLYRVLVPGGVIKAFSATRTFHRMAAAMQGAGFTKIGVQAWTYGSGFPKSMNIGKRIDAAAGAEREVVGERVVTRDLSRNGRTGDEAVSPVPVVGATIPITAPATPAARTWEGWGTALKPSWEPVLVGRKPE